MGTRNLIAVQHNGEYKVAQYGQWDGYPSGQGVSVLDFLKNSNLEAFKKKLEKIRFLEPEGRDKKFLEDYDKVAPQWSNDPDKRSFSQKHWFKTYMSRDLGAEILKNILHSSDKEILLTNRIDFAKDSLFCEYAYVIDLDKEVLEVYRGFNQSPVNDGERFAGKIDEKNEYYPVYLLETFNINDLPTEKVFLEVLNEEEE